MDNIFYILSRSKGFILSSLWEDPGFVIVEAAFCKVPIISSDCDSGPKELIKDNINGILFKSNNIENFLIKFDEFIKLEKNPNKLLLNNLKMSKKFKNYLWDKNFGYGTSDHLQGLKKYGITKHHRKKFKPIHKILMGRTRETQ